MRSLDRSFCQLVENNLFLQKNLHTFCAKLRSTFSDHFPDARCQIWLKSPSSLHWQKLAYLSQDKNEIFYPPNDAINQEHELLFHLLKKEHLVTDEHHFHLLFPIRTRKDKTNEFSVALILSSSSTITLNIDCQKKLCQMLSTHLDAHLQHQAYLTEKKQHEKTVQDLLFENKTKKGLIKQLNTLHKISLRLWHTHSLDNMLHTAVYECIHYLDIDRMAIFLHNVHTNMIKGTYGTDIKGKISNEQWYCTPIDEHPQVKATLDKHKHITVKKNTPLFHNGVVVGKGWNATISLWDGDEPIGWIACDNLITSTELKGYHQQLLKLLGITMSQQIIQRRAQDALKSLNSTLERRVADRTAQLENANKKLNLISREDSLTNVANRRMFDEKLDEEWRRALRHKTQLSLLIVDIDYFKQYNDKYGHLIGDQCLIKVAKALSLVERRAGALFARYGGEEFVFLLPNCDHICANLIAQRALNAIIDLNITHESSPIKPYITVSIGGQSLIPKTMDQKNLLFNDADNALYQAKNQGKNRAIILKSKICQL